MAYEYEEVVNLVLNTNQFNVGLNSAKAMFARGKTELEKLSIIEFRVDDKTFLINLDKVYKNVVKAAEAQSAAVIKQEKKD